MYFPQTLPGYHRRMCDVPSSTMTTVPLENFIFPGAPSPGVARLWGAMVMRTFSTFFSILNLSKLLRSTTLHFAEASCNIKAAEWDYRETALFPAPGLHGSLLIPRGPVRAPWTVRRSNQWILKGINPEYSLGLMPMLQYFGHLMRRANSLERPWCWEKTEGRRKGWQRMRWLDGITGSRDINSSKLWEMVKNRKLGGLQSMGSQRVGHDEAAKQRQPGPVGLRVGAPLALKV